MRRGTVVRAAAAEAGDLRCVGRDRRWGPGGGAVV